MNNKGITLIAVIITIIVMLIIVGISVNFVAGKNSVINKAEDSQYLNSATQIEEMLNGIYTQNYSKIDEKNYQSIDEKTPITKARALAYYLEDELGDDNFFRPILNNYTFHKFTNDKFAYVSNDGKIFYFLSPSKLKKYNSSVEVLKIREPDNRTGSKDLSYLYGVTADLKVFVIRKGMNDILGVTDENLTSYDFNSIIYEAGSDWSRIFDLEGDVTYQEGQAKDKLTIDFSSVTVNNTFNFNGIGEMKYLDKLFLINPNVSEISGIADAGESLKYLWIECPNITDYTGLRYLSNLESLYLVNCSGEQFDKIMTELGNAPVPIKTLGILHSNTLNTRVGWRTWIHDFTYEAYYSHSVTDSQNSINTTDFASITKLNSVTKSKIQYMYLIGTNVDSLASIATPNNSNDFKNLVSIRADGNLINSFAGLNNKPNLTTIRICFNKLPNLNISGVPKLNFLDVRGNGSTLTSVSDIDNATKLKKLWFNSPGNNNGNCTNLNTDDLVAKKSFFNGLTELLIDPKYKVYLLDTNDTSRTKLEISSATIKESEFMKFSNFINCAYVSFDNITIDFDVPNGVLTEVSNDPTNSLLNATQKSEKATSILINRVLSNMPQIRHLQIIHMKNKIQSTEFLKSTKNLMELDFRDNNATDLQNLALPKNGNNYTISVKKLSIDNPNINLTSNEMQSVINNLSIVNGSYSTSYKIGNTSYGYNYYTYGYGLILCNNSLFSQLSNCNKIQYLILNRDWHYQLGNKAENIALNLSGCTNLKYIKIYDYYFSSLIMPSSLTKFEYGHITGNATKYGAIDIDLSRCSNIAEVYFNGFTYGPVVERAFRSLSTNQVGKNSLTTIKIYACTGTYGLTNFDVFSGFRDYTKLNYFKIWAQTGGSESFYVIDSINGLRNLSRLTYLYIAFCPIVDLPDFTCFPDLVYLKISRAWSSDTNNLTTISRGAKLGKLSKLEYLDLSYNNLTNLVGLVPESNSNDFASLKYLRLNDNQLEDNFIDGVFSYNIANDIVIPLFNKNLRSIHLLRNKFTTYDDIKNLGWTNFNWSTYVDPPNNKEPF